MRLLRQVFPVLSLMWANQLTAIIIVGGGNAVNISDPGNGAPWNEVARVTNSSGSHTNSGSAVHLGGGYMLTANHVNLSQGYVSFDGSNTYPIEGGSAVQVTSGMDVIDLKVFKLMRHPGTAGVNLFPESAKGSEAAFGAATHIGWGVGHDPVDTNNPWTWGDSATSQKRWGTNEFEWAILNFGSTIPTYNYDFEALATALDAGASMNEAAATLFDSGSGLFVEDEASNWFLAGTIVTVSTSGSSTFGTASAQDFNYSVRIAEYADEIASLKTNPIPVPESAAYAVLMGLLGLVFIGLRRSPTQSKTPGCRRSL